MKISQQAEKAQKKQKDKEKKKAENRKERQQQQIQEEVITIIKAAIINIITSDIEKKSVTIEQVLPYVVELEMQNAGYSIDEIFKNYGITAPDWNARAKLVHDCLEELKPTAKLALLAEYLAVGVLVQAIIHNKYEIEAAKSLMKLFGIDVEAIKKKAEANAKVAAAAKAKKKLEVKKGVAKKDGMGKKARTVKAK